MVEKLRFFRSLVEAAVVETTVVVEEELED